jgi:hypothetical protein
MNTPTDEQLARALTIYVRSPKTAEKSLLDAFTYLARVTELESVESVDLSDIELGRQKEYRRVALEAAAVVCTGKPTTPEYVLSLAHRFNEYLELGVTPDDA